MIKAVCVTSCVASVCIAVIAIVSGEAALMFLSVIAVGCLTALSSLCLRDVAEAHQKVLAGDSKSDSEPFEPFVAYYEAAPGGAIEVFVSDKDYVSNLRKDIVDALSNLDKNALLEYKALVDHVVALNADVSIPHMKLLQRQIETQLRKLQ